MPDYLFWHLTNDGYIGLPAPGMANIFEQDFNESLFNSINRTEMNKVFKPIKNIL